MNDSTINTQDVMISVRDLHRSFGRVKAVRGVSFDIMRGQVVGFIGSNGAGKTTTMRLISTLEEPDEGSVHICGIDALDNPTEVRRRIGWVPDDFGRYPNLSILEYLQFFAASFGYGAEERQNRIVEILEFTGLESLKERFTDKLSKGQGQRLCLARALLHDPEILILDEPAAGLDPKARVELKNLLRILGEEGKTIFISSHILSELQEMCDTMIFLDKGRVVHSGNAEDLKRHQGSELIVHIAFTGEADLESWAAMNPGVKLRDQSSKSARLIFDKHDDEFLADSLRRLVLEGIQVTEFRREERRLEDAFVDIVDKLERDEQLEFEEYEDEEYEQEELLQEVGR